MAEGETQMTEPHDPSPSLDEHQNNDENEDKETVTRQGDEQIIQSGEEEIIQSCQVVEEEEEDPGKINAEEEKEVEQFDDPIKVQVQISGQIGEEQVIEIPQLELEEKQNGEEQQKKEIDTVNVEQQRQDDEMEGPPPGWDSLPLPPQLPPSPQPEMGQMVCGSCRHLLSYTQGSKHVRCSCCLTVNYVLEEHQVGQVKCEICTVLLMYPFGAQSVRCCSCCSVINISDHNRRPSLSVQQSQACRPFSIGH